MSRVEHAAEHERHYQELRLRVQQRHRDAVAALDVAAPASAGSDPTGSDPTGSDPTGSDPTAGDPTAQEPDDGMRTTSVLRLPEYSPAAGTAASGELVELVTAVDELLAFAGRMPALADLPARALSVQVVRAAALACLLGAVLEGLGIWRGLLGVGWAVAVAVGLAATVGVALLPVAPAAGRHRRQRWTAVLCGAAGLACGPVAAVWGWLPGLAALAVQAGALVVLRDVRRGMLRGRR